MEPDKCNSGLCVVMLGGSATSSPAMLGIREHRLSKRRAQSSMQLHNYYGDANRNKTLYTGMLWECDPCFCFTRYEAAVVNM